MGYEQITTELDDEVLTITLNRPEKLNAWTHTMIAEMSDAIAQGNDDDGIGAFVIAGAGRAFCAGADIEALFKTQADSGEISRGPEASSNWVDLVRTSKPMVAAVHGVCFGVGLSQLMGMDVIVAARDARMSFRFIKMGLIPELGSSRFLVARAGFGQASRLMLSGDTFSGEEAAQMGLADVVVEADALLDEAKRIARSMGTNPGWAVREVKKLLTENMGETDLDVVQRRELQSLKQAYKTPEHLEAIDAFMQKREPDFKRARRGSSGADPGERAGPSAYRLCEAEALSRGAGDRLGHRRRALPEQLEVENLGRPDRIDPLLLERGEERREIDLSVAGQQSLGHRLGHHVVTARGARRVVELHAVNSIGRNLVERVEVGPARLSQPVPGVDHQTDVVEAGRLHELPRALDVGEPRPGQPLDADLEATVGRDLPEMREPARRGGRIDLGRHHHARDGLGAVEARHVEGAAVHLVDLGRVATLPADQRLDDRHAEPAIVVPGLHLFGGDASPDGGQVVEGPERDAREAGVGRRIDDALHLVGRDLHGTAHQGGVAQHQSLLVHGAHGVSISLRAGAVSRPADRAFEGARV